MKSFLRDIIEIDEELCNGCGQCISDCAEGALALVNGKAKVVADIYCDGLGACLSGCPTGALRIVQRQAAPFDEQAVHERLARQSGGLPRYGMPASPGEQPNWPMKLRLVRPDAPGLFRRPLLLAADCTAFASEKIHSALGKDNRILIGCPKFEEATALTRQLAEVLQHARPEAITVARMEVPCCKALSRICLEAVAMSGIGAPVMEAVVDREGDIAFSAGPLKADAGLKELAVGQACAGTELPWLMR